MSTDEATTKWEAEIVRLTGLIEDQKRERIHLRVWPLVGIVAGIAVGFFVMPAVGIVAFLLSIVTYFVGIYLTHVHISERTFLLERAQEQLDLLSRKP